MHSIITNTRAFVRFLSFVLILVFFVARYLMISIVKGLNLDRALEHRKRFANLMHSVLAVDLTRSGTPSAEPVLYVCNHRSYFDPVIIFTKAKALPVAKAEVARWPLVGLAAKISGVLYVRREDKSSRRQIREAIVRTIHSGYSVLIFPEGTTHTKATTIDFRPGAFQVVAKAGIPVVPIAIEYQNSKDAWVDEDTFVRHFFECFGKAKTKARICYGHPIRSRDPEVLMTQAKQWIDIRLRQMRKEFGLI